jgi:ESCRT-I complex subunit VPS28
LARLSLMASMKASDELNDEQVRQLLFDLETSYTAFHNSLGGGK